MARALADAGMDAVYSYAGRTGAPLGQPLPVRIGGFGGVAGLADFLRCGGFTHLIDATHPFAAQISQNAVAAAQTAGIAMIALERPGWQAQPGDDWRHVADISAAVSVLPDAAARIFLAIGRQNLAAFAAMPQHHYLLRLVDPPDGPLPVPHATVIVARGPFDVAGDLALMRDHGITHLVAKNAGGQGAEAKITAARALHLPVILIERPALPPRPVTAHVAQVMAWLGHARTERGV